MCNIFEILATYKTNKLLRNCIFRAIYNNSLYFTIFIVISQEKLGNFYFYFVVSSSLSFSSFSAVPCFCIVPFLFIIILFIPAISVVEIFPSIVKFFALLNTPSNSSTLLASYISSNI